MSHEIDMSNNQANIAFVGETPWHGLGQQLTPGADIATWIREAGLDWNAIESPVWFNPDGEPNPAMLSAFPKRKALVRSDTKSPLSIVSSDYKVVQPAQVMEMYAELAKVGDFQLEVAGCLSGGKRVWALAKAGDGAAVVNGDKVEPYVLLGTSFDATMATIMRRTAVRVVCNNTIQMSLEAESSATVRVFHSEKFDAEAMRKELGVFASEFEQFMHRAQALAGKSMTQPEADTFLVELLKPFADVTLRVDEKLRKSKGYGKVMALFQGGAKGSEFAPATRWQMLNAVTQYVDHDRGRTSDTRMESAWFGTGNTFKNKAMELLAA